MGWGNVYMYIRIRLLALVCPFISSFVFLSFSFQFRHIKIIWRHIFLRNYKAYKVENYYKHEQWVDLIMYNRTRLLRHNIHPFIHFSFFPISKY